jgi:hypothetical protein
VEEIREIGSQKVYKEYLTRVEEPMEEDPSPHSENGKLLETLVVMIEDYERRQGWEIPL